MLHFQEILAVNQDPKGAAGRRWLAVGQEGGVTHPTAPSPDTIVASELATL